MKKLILRQIIMLSKWTFYGLIFNVFTLGTLWANMLNAQEIKSIKEISIHLETMRFSVEDLFKEIEHKTNFSFSYNKEDIDPNIKIRVNKSEALVADVLLEISKNSDLKFRQVNNSIHVKTKSRYSEKEKPLEIFIQDINVTGRVTSAEDNQGLPGVNVIIKGTNTGTVTDIDGNYSIGVSSSSEILVFSSVGFLTEEVNVDQKSVINIVLTSDIQSLSEVVVIGYGTQKKGDITGAIAQMDAEKLNERPINRIDQALVGQMAGVHIKQTSGMPGQGFSIQVRGTGSISANQEPLYVIDGFPLEVSAQNSGGNFSSGNPLDNINPNDIESIQVLKDASAAAIYGARGSNGVVLITTKSGKSGKASINFNAYAGWNERSRKLDMLSAEEWVERAVEHINYNWVNSGPGRTVDQTTDERIAINGSFNRDRMIDERWLQPGHPGLTYHDWQDEMFRRGAVQNYQLSANGGNEFVKYYVSGDYLDQEGFIRGVDYKRYSARANVEVKASDKISFGINLSPSYSISNDPGVEGKDQQMHLAVSVPPISIDTVGALFNTGEYGPYVWGSSRNSPIAVAENATGLSKIFRTLTTVFVEYQIVDGLAFKTTFNLDNADQSSKFYRPAWVSGGGPANRQASGNFSGYKRQTFVNENTLSFIKTFTDVHNFSAVAGISYNTNKFEQFRITGSDGFTTDFITTLNDAVGINTANNRTFTSERKNVLLSYFGRLGYNYDSRYLIQAVIRRDGSSRFGDDTKWGIFPSLSAGWRLSEESFMTGIGTITDLKLRASWGLTGNEAVGGDYEHIALLDPTNYVIGGQLAPGQAPANFPNTGLSWEDSETFDIGLDFGLFENRITGSFDYYTKRNTNLLLNIPVPASTGFTNAYTNIGEVLNKGWEVELNTRNLTGQLQWHTGINFSHNTNEVVNLGPDNAPILGGAWDINHNILMVGEPMYSLYVVHQDGILSQADIDGGTALYGNQVAGDPKYVDYNNDGVISPDDRQLSGHPNPDYIGGITNTFTFKGFDLSVLFQGQWGGKIYSTFGRSVDRTGMGWLDNAIGAHRDRWRSPEDPGEGVKGKSYSSFGRIKNTDWLYSSDYWRVRNITLGYNLGNLIKNKVVSNARIYITAENYFGKDKYTGGFNPEAVNTDGDDYGAVPLPRSMVFGLNLTF